MPCVALGRPTCGRVLCCLWAPILRTCLALCWGAQPCWGCIKKSTSNPKFVLIHPPACLLAYSSLVWTFSLRMSFAFGRPSYGRALRCVEALNSRMCRRALRCRRTLGSATCGRTLHCVGAPNFRTGLVLCLGAHLVDVPCVALGRPTLVRPYSKVYLQAKICSYPSSSSYFSLVLCCVDVFVVDEFFIWATILRSALRCVGAPNLRTCGCALCLRCKSALGRPTCRRALRCVGAFNLQMCLALRWGTQLADVPCVAFGCLSCGRAFRCLGATNLGEAILKSPPPSRNLFLSILQLVF
jgi:hypothetical protein